MFLERLGTQPEGVPALEQGRSQHSKFSLIEFSRIEFFFHPPQGPKENHQSLKNQCSPTRRVHVIWFSFTAESWCIYTYIYIHLHYFYRSIMSTQVP